MKNLSVAPKDYYFGLMSVDGTNFLALSENSSSLDDQHITNRLPKNIVSILENIIGGELFEMQESIFELEEETDLNVLRKELELQGFNYSSSLFE
jgi:hypothetical protein